MVRNAWTPPSSNYIRRPQVCHPPPPPPPPPQPNPPPPTTFFATLQLRADVGLFGITIIQEFFNDTPPTLLYFEVGGTTSEGMPFIWRQWIAYQTGTTHTIVNAQDDLGDSHEYVGDGTIWDGTIPTIIGPYNLTGPGLVEGNVQLSFLDPP